MLRRRPALGKLRSNSIVGLVVMGVLALTLGSAPRAAAEPLPAAAPSGTPIVTSIAPECGPIQGGQKVLITGSGLAGATLVDFDGSQGTDVKVRGGSVNVKTPPHDPGTVHVRVANSSGTSPVSGASRYTYVDVIAMPEMNPVCGLTAGGSTVNVAIPDAKDVVGVAFGTLPASSFKVKGRTVTVTAPAQGLGTVDVIVSLKDGTSRTVGRFAYYDQDAPAAVTDVTATPSESSVALAWTNPSDEDFSGVMIRRAEGQIAPSSASSGTFVTDTSGPDTAFTDTSVVAGTQYSYAVFSHDSVPNYAPATTITTTTPQAPGPVELAVSLSAPIGSTNRVALTGVDAVTQLTTTATLDGVNWASGGTGLVADIAMTAQVGTFTVTLRGVGCVQGDCTRQLAVTVTLTITGLAAPNGTAIDTIVEPSTDRIKTGTSLLSGAATRLTDEVTVVLGTPELPGTRAQADVVAADVGAVVAGGWEDIGVYQLRWMSAQDTAARIDQLTTMTGVAGVDQGLLISRPESGAGLETTPGELSQSADRTWHLTQAKLPEAWKTVTGSGVNVGIVDQGLVGDHPDLSITYRLDSMVIPVANHATQVAGLACGKPDGVGIVGAGAGCSILSDTGVYVSDPTADPETDRLTSLLSDVGAVRRVIGKGAAVVNLSISLNPRYWLSGGACLTSDQTGAVTEALGTRLGTRSANAFRRVALTVGADVVFAVAAGNDCADVPVSPFLVADDLPNVVSVASVNASGNLSSFSNMEAEVAAGGGVYSDADQGGVWSTLPAGQYGQEFGTSMASPLVAGIAALIRAKYPDLTADGVGRAITSSGSTLVTQRDDHTPSHFEIEGKDVAIDPSIDYTRRIPLVDAAKALAIVVPTITSTTLPKATIDKYYSAVIQAADGDGRYNFSLVNISPGLPEGLNWYGDLGIWEGTPTKAGHYTMTIEVTDEHGMSSTATVTLDILAPSRMVVWGDDSSSQGRVPMSPEPAQAIAAGLSHTLALREDGTVVAWGDNTSGQTTVPEGLTGVSAIAAGSYHSLALKEDGTVVAWGHLTAVQAIELQGLTGVAAIAAGSEHSLALKSDGTVVAWGNNDFGDFGQATVPSGLEGVTAIAAGSQHSLALKSDGTVVAWGYNSYGQATVPEGLTGVTAISAGSGHSLALKGDGTVVAWGNNDDGQATVPNWLSGVTAIAAGFDHNLALKSDGTVVAWGSMTYGEGAVPEGLAGVTAIAAGSGHSLALQGDGTVVAWGYYDSGQTSVPVTPIGVTAIAAGSAHSLALQGDGTVVAWGDNHFGQTTVPEALTGVTAITAGSAHSLALKEDGTVVAWGRNDSGQAMVPSGLRGVTAIAAGGAHSLALMSDGTVVAWGENTYGQATIPEGLNGVTAIAAGMHHSLALKEDGTVVAWGYNKDGQAAVPEGLSGVTAISAGWGHNLVLKEDGTVVAWGYIALGEAAVPEGLNGVTAIAAGGWHSLALKEDGTVVAWGANNYGQAAVPEGLSGVTAIAAGWNHSLALRAN